MYNGKTKSRGHAESPKPRFTGFGLSILLARLSRRMHRRCSNTDMHMYSYQTAMMPCSGDWISLPPIIYFASRLLHLCEHLLHLLSRQLTLWDGGTPQGSDRISWRSEEGAHTWASSSTPASFNWVINYLVSLCIAYGLLPAEMTYVRSSISQVLVEAQLDHLHLTRYLCRIQSYTSASSPYLAHSLGKWHTLILHHFSNFQHSINGSLVVLDLVKEWLKFGIGHRILRCRLASSPYWSRRKCSSPRNGRCLLIWLTLLYELYMVEQSIDRKNIQWRTIDLIPFGVPFPRGGVHPLQHRTLRLRLR
jgi:hypothetical protein